MKIMWELIVDYSKQILIMIGILVFSMFLYYVHIASIHKERQKFMDEIKACSDQRAYVDMLHDYYTRIQDDLFKCQEWKNYLEFQLIGDQVKKKKKG